MDFYKSFHVFGVGVKRNMKLQAMKYSSYYIDKRRKEYYIGFAKWVVKKLIGKKRKC